MLRSSARTLLPLALLLAPRAALAQTSPPPGPPPALEDEAFRAPPPDAGDEDARWKRRDQQLFEQDALGGGVGLLHTQHAQSGAPGQLRLGFTSELFSSGFLCTSTYPCPNPKGGAPLTSDTMTHLGGTLTLSATITEWFEAYAATGAYGNSDSANHPSILQVFGDTALGFKFFHPLNSVFHVGGVTELDLVNGSGAVGLAGDGTGARFRLLGTADLRGRHQPVPLRISLNLGYAIDNSAQVLSGYEATTGAPVTRIQRFGLDVNRVDNVNINLGVETFFASERVRPFLEYQILIPINRQGYACPVVNASNDGCLANDALAPSKLTIGSRFFPWKHGFSLTAGLDIGVTGVGNFIEEVTPTPPWMLYLGAGWAIDTQERAPVETTRVVERVIPPKMLGELQGRVHVKDKTDPIAEAILTFTDHPEVTARVSGADGTFHVPVEPGKYAISVHAKGFRDGTCGGEMPEAPPRSEAHPGDPRVPPASVPVDCVLEPALVEVTANEITISQQIQFQVDSAVILGESDGLMHEIADTLIKNPRISLVEVAGHTDSSGSVEHNKTLSEQRAAAVKDWLTGHGVAAERLVARGYGEERPLIPNVTKGMKAQNRRVQFIILTQTGQLGPNGEPGK